ncbi:MAG: ribonuclease P protein subunit [Candidatus Nitrosothermus koennekii]|nr:MAG: ribonuclease P protein subunit [Candidatus Nitrosothermus koennekii]
MNITCDNIHAHELIGLDTKIIDSNNPILINKEDKIIYESKNMLFIKINNSMKKVPKSIVKLEFVIDDNKCIINGKDIIGKPEDRIRRL